MAHAQSTDPLTRSLQSSTTSALVVEAVPLEHSPHPLYCDTSTGTQRPIVPLPWRHTVFKSLHNLSHPGIWATQKLITSRFVWPGINSEYSPLDLFLYTMPTSKDAETHYSPSLSIPYSRCSLRCRPHRYLWTTTTITRLYLPPHMRGSLHPLA